MADSGLRPFLKHARLPYSQDLAPCDLCLFPEIEFAFKEARFEAKPKSSTACRKTACSIASNNGNFVWGDVEIEKKDQNGRNNIVRVQFFE